MLIGIDGNEANALIAAGVHQMANKLLWELYKLEGGKKSPNQYLIFLKNPPGKGLPKANSYWKYKVVRGGKVWILTKLLPTLYKDRKIDLLLSLSHYLPPISPVPMVCVITDLGYLKFSGQFRKYDYWQLKYWTAISLYVSKYIIAISDFTKRDILHKYKFTEGKVKTVHLGHDPEYYNDKISEDNIMVIRKKYRIPKNYIIFMSLLKPSKNVEGLLDAYATIKQNYDYKLVIVGKKGWMYENIFKKIKELKLEQDVIFTDYLADNERSALLKGSKALVLPSFWEGFGIDVLNAFSCGVPVVISKRASLPEVGGEAGIYVNPDLPESIVGGIKKVLKMSPKEYNNQVQLGFAQLQKFSWQKTARGVLGVLEKAGKH